MFGKFLYCRLAVFFLFGFQSIWTVKSLFYWLSIAFLEWKYLEYWGNHSTFKSRIPAVAVMKWGVSLPVTSSLSRTLPAIVFPRNAHSGHSLSKNTLFLWSSPLAYSVGRVRRRCIRQYLTLKTCVLLCRHCTKKFNESQLAYRQRESWLTRDDWRCFWHRDTCFCSKWQFLYLNLWLPERQNLRYP